jgi:ABC-type Fe3+/spermidine/putrescine transport system ATPase subunit
MDEPLSNLDARLRAEMRTELKALVRRLGVTTIYVTHDQREALSMADRVAVMRDGSIVQCAAPRALYDEPANEFVASFVGETNVFEGEVKRVDDDIVEVKTAFEVLKALKGSQEVAKGDTVRVLVRPEDITVGAALEGSNIIGGRVADIAFAGGIEEVFVELPGAARAHVMRSLKNAETLELGETVEIAFDANRTRLFKPEG